MAVSQNNSEPPASAAGFLGGSEDIEVVETPKEGFSYVFVPADSSQPMEERWHHTQVTLENDTFIHELKKLFAKTNAQVDQSMLKKQIEERSKQQIDDKVMEALEGITSIDIFPMLMPVKETKFHGVSCYVDDKGVSKNLPVNERLTNLGRAAGYPDNVFRGDAFLSKIFDDQDAWERIDFKLSECSSDAPWIQLSQHQRKKSASSGMGGGMGAQNLQSLMGGMHPNMAINGMPGQMPPGMQLAGQQNALPPAEGETEHYEWKDSTNGEEIEVSFKTPEHCQKLNKKEVSVKFPAVKSKPLVVTVAGKELLNAAVFGSLEADECSWSIVDQKLVVTLMKKETAKWSSLLA